MKEVMIYGIIITLFCLKEVCGMALTKTDFDNLDVRIENIVSQSVEQIQVETDLPDRKSVV